MSMRTAEFSCLDIAPVHLHVYIYAFLFVCMYAHICILTANFLCSISGLFSSCCAIHIDVHMYVCMPAYLNSLPTSSASISECCSSCCAVHIDVHMYIFT